MRTYSHVLLHRCTPGDLYPGQEAGTDRLPYGPTQWPAGEGAHLRWAGILGVVFGREGRVPTRT